jgi:hypothetical protein
MKNNPVQNIVRDVVTSYVTTSKVLLVGSILGIGSIGTNPAQATSLVNGTGISNPAATITFSEIPLANGTALTNQYTSLGVTFTGLFYNPFASSFPNITPPSAGNFPNSTFNPRTNPFIISFSQSQSAAAFSLASGSAGTSTFEALLNGTVVDSFSSATSFDSSTNFYGFTGVTLGG